MGEAGKLEERLMQLEDLPEVLFPEGLDAEAWKTSCRKLPPTSPFPTEPGGSFIHTLPPLYPRGYLQVFDDLLSPTRPNTAPVSSVPGNWTVRCSTGSTVLY